MSISRRKFVIGLAIIALPVAFFSYRYKGVFSRQQEGATTMKTTTQTNSARAVNANPTHKPFASEPQIISDTLTATSRVVVVEKDGIQKHVFIPLTLPLTKEEILDGLFSDVPPTRKPANLSLNQHLTFYGLTVDERTNLLAGVNVQGRVLIVDEQNRRQWIPKEIVSDAAGRFEFNQDSGQLITINVSKGTNYISPPPQSFEYGPVRYGPLESEFISDPNAARPKVFVLTKKQTPEKLVEVDRGWTAPNTGEPVRIDLTTGQMVPTGGDLVVSIWCPEPYVEGEHFPWKLSVHVVDGGLVSAETDRLENLLIAPESGYVEEFTLEYGVGSEPWRAQHRAFYYLKSRHGQIYAKLHFDMHTRWDKRGVPFGLRAFVNTNASRNLQVIAP